ncbi:LysR family transcriptional regulator substrate-binding protein [Bacillus hominis]|uniref:LysR family transcriptional regulator substrate-binding protein n=1 Tax=Bacillus hominis TaxID=2817478 RepID=UPI0025A0BB3B|nr:LysR family transcriptional regulator substrate-binding protein [Bacillus hominis]MDM5193697.1 LysR family transcriptional regulator substrate-binding protein [Bacillus hominis]
MLPTYLSDIRNAPFCANIIHLFFRSFKLLLHTLIVFDVMESLIQMVAQGMGITVLPKPYIEFLQSEHIQAIQIENPTPTIDIGLIYRKDKYMCAATQEFIGQLKITVHSLQN